MSRGGSRAMNEGGSGVLEVTQSIGLDGSG